jgi:hypothetical protein
MNKKLFSLIIASSIIAQPIIAYQDERHPNTAAINNAHDKGFIKGIATSLVASSLAMCAYLSSIKDNLYIPAAINPKLIPTGETRWVETIQKISDRTTIKSGHSEPVYKQVWETNPLHTALTKTPNCSTINGNPVQLNESMIQTMGSYMPAAIAISGFCAFFGMIVYSMDMIQTAHEKQAAQEKQNAERQQWLYGHR